MNEPEKISDTAELDRAKAWLERMAPTAKFEPEPGKVSDTIRCKICGRYAFQDEKGGYVFDHDMTKHETTEEDVKVVTSPRMVGDEDRPAGRSLFGYDN